MRIAVVAPSCPLKREAAERVQAIVTERGDCEIVIHPQCFLVEGHFAGPDKARLQALREVMADPTVDAVWFARGGYGSNRIAEAILADLPGAARDKLYLGYSDAGFLQAGLHKAALDAPSLAFNLTVLSNLLGTSLEPDFAGVELLIEDVEEQLYRIDRTMFHVTANPAVRKVRRLRLGRINNILPNDPIFAGDEVSIVEQWCARSGIPYGGRADIGHDAANRVVPFGLQF